MNICIQVQTVQYNKQFLKYGHFKYIILDLKTIYTKPEMFYSVIQSSIFGHPQFLVLATPVSDGRCTHIRTSPVAA